MLRPCPCFQHQGSCLLAPPTLLWLEQLCSRNRSCTHPCVTATPVQRPCVDQLVSHARRSRNYTTEMGRGVSPSSVIGAGNCVFFNTRLWMTGCHSLLTHTLPGYKQPISCENTCTGRAYMLRLNSCWCGRANSWGQRERIPRLWPLGAGLSRQINVIKSVTFFPASSLCYNRWLMCVSPHNVSGLVVI